MAKLNKRQLKALDEIIEKASLNRALFSLVPSENEAIKSQIQLYVNTWIKMPLEALYRELSVTKNVSDDTNFSVSED
jgi:hypothetical protein